MKQTLFLLSIVALFFIGPHHISAQNGLPPAAANRGMALGGTGVTFTDQFSAWTNPAGLAQLEAFGVNLSGEQRFGLSELKQVNLGAALPTAFGGFGFTASSFGYSGLRESRVTLAYGRSLTDNFRLGGEIIGLNTGIEGYSSRFAATFALGMQVDIIPELTVGFRAYSPFRVEVVENEYLPQLFTVGFGYRPNNKLLLLAEVDQDLDVETRFRAGLEYNLTSDFDLRFGISTGPAEMSIGAGYRINEKIGIQIAARYHETLGLTPGVGLIYSGK